MLKENLCRTFQRGLGTRLESQAVEIRNLLQDMREPNCPASVVAGVYDERSRFGGLEGRIDQILPNWSECSICRVLRNSPQPIHHFRSDHKFRTRIMSWSHIVGRVGSAVKVYSGV